MTLLVKSLKLPHPLEEFKVCKERGTDKNAGFLLVEKFSRVGKGNFTPSLSQNRT